MNTNLITSPVAGIPDHLGAIRKTSRTFRKQIKALPKDQRPDQAVYAIFANGLGLRNTKRKYTGQDAMASIDRMKIHAHNAASASLGDAEASRLHRAMGRTGGAMRELESNAVDLISPMERIVGEEEDRKRSFRDPLFQDDYS